MRLTFFTLCVIAAMLPGVSAAQFKWIDASGRVNYGDTPSADARKVEQVSRPFTGDADPVATLPLEVRRAVASFPVTMYTSADCGTPCNAGRDLLRARGTPFTEITIGTPQDLEAFRKLGFGDRVPVLTVGRQSVPQLQSDRWNELLDSAGYPRNAVLPRSWSNPAPRPLTPPAPTAAASAAPPAPPGSTAPATDGYTPLPNPGPAAR
jgi:hypothetical protein